LNRSAIVAGALEGATHLFSDIALAEVVVLHLGAGFEVDAGLQDAEAFGRELIELGDDGLYAGLESGVGAESGLVRHGFPPR
jgi:hypothetical protein